jgi:hypothetical protein
MPIKLIVIFLYIVNNCFSQVKPQPTRFDRFVHKPKITWAAYASDTFSFTGFNEFLLRRLELKQIKASLPVDSRSAEADQIKYVSFDSINRVFFDEDAEKKIDSTTFKITEVTQILYIKDGKLKSYIPWVTPAVPTYISTGTYIGERFYFNTAYNYKYDHKPRKRHKPVFLGRTSKMIRLDDPANKLKEMYGQNLLTAAWSHISGSGTTVYTADGIHKLDPTSINIVGGKRQMQPVPIYDSTSRSTINKYIVAEGPEVTGEYTHVQLVQDWYYAQKRNIMINYIREMVVYMTREKKETVPVLKLVFK